MKNAVIPVVSLAIMVGIVYAIWPQVKATPTPGKPPSPIKWSNSYSLAVAEAKSQHKIIMIDFYTDWCEWCKQLDTDVYPDPDVIKAVSKLVPVKLNAETDGASLAAKYGVTGYPTIVFLNSDGTLISQIVGYEDAGQFAADVNKAASAAGNSVAEEPHAALSIDSFGAQALRKASTQAGSHCDPAPAAIIDSAFCGFIPLRYGRSVVIALNASATAMTRAMNGVASPFSPNG